MAHVLADIWSLLVGIWHWLTCRGYDIDVTVVLAENESVTIRPLSRQRLYTPCGLVRASGTTRLSDRPPPSLATAQYLADEWSRPTLPSARFDTIPCPPPEGCR